MKIILSILLFLVSSAIDVITEQIPDGENFEELKIDLSFPMQSTHPIGNFRIRNLAE